MTSQVTSESVVYSTVYIADQRKHISPESLVFVRGIHWSPMNSPDKGPVTRKMFPFDDVIIQRGTNLYCYRTTTQCCTINAKAMKVAEKELKWKVYLRWLSLIFIHVCKAHLEYNICNTCQFISDILITPLPLTSGLCQGKNERNKKKGRKKFCLSLLSFITWIGLTQWITNRGAGVEYLAWPNN